MNSSLTLVSTVVLLAFTHVPLTALAQTQMALAQTQMAPAAAAAAAAAGAVKAPISTKAPTDWIQYTDTTFTPVLDDVSTHLAAARVALASKDSAKAAESMQAAASALQIQAELAARIDRQRAAADIKLARDTHARLAALVKKLEVTAVQLKAGKITTTAQLDKTLDKAARADLERRWLVTDVTTWYPVAEEPQRHFLAASEDFAKKDYKAAATEVREASAYLRLESARAIGEAKSGLAAADAALEKTAAALDKGAVKDKKQLEQVFANADHALGLAHRARAADLWARKAYDKAGYELKASAQGVESAATWTSGEAKAAAASAADDARAIGEKLASGGVWTRNEVAKGFESLGNALNKLGHAVGSNSTASPFDVGA
jgi:hypothetical protein